MASNVEKCDLALTERNGHRQAIGMGEVRGVKAFKLPRKSVKVQVRLKRVAFQVA